MNGKINCTASINEIFSVAKERFGDNQIVVGVFPQLIKELEKDDLIKFINKSPQTGTDVWELYERHCKAVNLPSGGYTFVDFAKQIIASSNPSLA